MAALVLGLPTSRDLLRDACSLRLFFPNFLHPSFYRCLHGLGALTALAPYLIPSFPPSYLSSSTWLLLLRGPKLQQDPKTSSWINKKIYKVLQFITRALELQGDFKEEYMSVEGVDSLSCRLCDSRPIISHQLAKQNFCTDDNFCIINFSPFSALLKSLPQKVLHLLTGSMDQTFFPYRN